MDNKDLTSIDFFNKKIKENRQKQKYLKNKRIKNIIVPLVIIFGFVFVYIKIGRASCRERV